MTTSAIAETKFSTDCKARQKKLRVRACAGFRYVLIFSTSRKCFRNSPGDATNAVSVDKALNKNKKMAQMY